MSQCGLNYKSASIENKFPGEFRIGRLISDSELNGELELIKIRLSLTPVAIKGSVRVMTSPPL
jgi:hypothetical protein